MVPATAEAPVISHIPRTPEAAATPEATATPDAASVGKALMCLFEEYSEVLIETGYHQGSASAFGTDTNSKMPSENAQTVNASTRPMQVLMMAMIFP